MIRIQCCLGLLIAALTVTHVHAQEPRPLGDGTILLENFEHDATDGLPSGWYDRDGNAKLIDHSPDFTREYHYRVLEEEGNSFLRYEGTRAKHINLPLVNHEDMINIHETPVLSWRARAHQLPEGANEDDNDRNDAVMSVYVVFDFGRVLFRKVPKSIRYSWSTTRPEGAEYSKLFGNQKIMIVESGIQRVGEWVTFERNIVEDYRRMFGDMPPETPVAILILSDGDSTGSFVKADYDDFILKPENR